MPATAIPRPPRPSLHFRGSKGGENFARGELGELEKLARDWLHILPPWLNRLTFVYHPAGAGDGEDAPTIMSTESSYSYRVARVHVYPQFFAAPEQDRPEYLVHEFCHILLAPYALVADKQVGAAYAEEEGADKVVRDALDSAEEQAVEDLAHVLLGMARLGLES